METGAWIAMGLIMTVIGYYIGRIEWAITERRDGLRSLLACYWYGRQAALAELRDAIEASGTIERGGDIWRLIEDMETGASFEVIHAERAKEGGIRVTKREAGE